MEIIIYIRKGAITHKDSLGNKGVTSKGAIQIMSAGTGIPHSEYNHENEETLLFQIWIQPNKMGIKPRWENVEINSTKIAGINALASGQNKYKETGIVIIHQDTTLYSVLGDKDYSQRYTLANDRQIYLVVTRGGVIINDSLIDNRDGVFIKNEEILEIIFEILS